MRSITEFQLPQILAITVLAAILSSCGHKVPPQSQEIDPASRRQTSNGSVVGVHGRYGNLAWLGIPYAQPPVGALRWKAPQSATPWGDTLSATSPPQPCPQIASPLGGIVDAKAGTPVGSEDCLYLNVYTPSEQQSAPLPVMVWIHGGGNVIGHSGFYDGGNLAQREKVVVVIVQYRLGPLGWFYHPALQHDASNAERSGNFGTLDLIQALRWVRDNIGAFGGDADRVTIFGESAGARNVISLLLSPQGRGLFHGAIAQSGATNILSPAQARNLRDATPAGVRGSSEEAIVALLLRDGKATTRSAAIDYLRKSAPRQMATYLRSKSPVELLRAYQSDQGEGLIRVANVIGDGNVITAGDAIENLASGNAAPVPAIFGTNRDEQKVFMFTNARWTRRILGILPRLRDADLYTATAKVMSRLWTLRGVVRPANARRQAGATTYAYRWDWDEEPSMLGAELSQMVGAAHGFEIPFVFGHFDLGPEGNVIFTSHNETGRVQLSNAMMSYWANFARTGSPGRGTRGDLPDWQAWGTGRTTRILFDTDEGGGIRATSETPSRDAIFAELENDPRLADAEHRCTVLREITQWTEEIDDDYLRSKGCR